MNINRNTAIAAILAFTLLAGLSTILYDDSSHLNLLLKERLVEKETLFDELRKMKNSPVEKMVKDYSYWDELVKYVGSPTDKWALDNLDSSFATYNFHSLWVYRKDGILIRSVQKAGSGGQPGAPFPLAVSRVESLISRGNNYAQFYIATPQGVMEIYASPIRSSKNSGEGGASGFLLAGVLLDEKYLGELSYSAHSTVYLKEHAATTAEAVTDPRQGIIVFSRDLQGLDGRPLKMLSVRMDAPDIRHIARQKEKNALIGTGLIAVLYILAGFLLLSRQRLKMANLNLDVAQVAARMGSWQRHLESGVCCWSDNLYILFGLPKSGAKPSLETFYTLVHPKDLPRVRSVIEQAVEAKEGYDVEFLLIRPDGEIRTMRSKGSVMLVDGMRGRIVGYTQDITELARMTNELVALNARKDGLITMLSHDLRTPLTPLTILLPVISKRVENHELRKMVDLCCECTANIKKLADNASLLVTLFAAIETGELESITLASVVEQSIAESAGILAQKHLTCQNELDPTLVVRGIPGQLKVLFGNLISNAVRFSTENGNIRISAEQYNGMVTIEVHDDGIGLDHDHLERIFDEFFKVDESRHDLDTPGLGLAICKRIVRNHHGRIWAESPGLGRGTTIGFTINENGRSAHSI
ncbi:MAG: ATP-binding protein [Pseudomonadota bacterium]